MRAALGERYRAFAPDLPGHGDAAWRRPATIGACVAYLRALPFGDFHLAGYSMGGRLALAAALELGAERVPRLTLIGASPGIADPAERADRRAADERLAARIEAIGTEAFAKEWAELPLFRDQPRGVADLAHADRLRNPPDGLAASLRGMGTGAMEPLWDRLPELQIPVTLVVGERDARYREIAERMAEQIPRARVVVVVGAGHAAHLEAPAAVADAMR